jgi:hypothetical protein
LGIKYESVRQPSEHGYIFPCITAGCTGCDKKQLSTPEELDAEEQYFKQRTKMALEAIVAIQQHAGDYKKGEGKRGVIDCPTCKAKLHYSRAGYNGHIHAQCETKGCVSFMQ